MDYYVKKDYYKILDVKNNATQDEIKAAYRKKAKEFHPDLYANNPLAELANEKLKEINEAYEILGDENKRAEYDLQQSNQNFYNFAKSTPQNEQTQSKNNNEDYSYERPQENRYSGKEYQGKVNKEQACYRHSNRIGVAQCEVCGTLLCEECAALFNPVLCFNCIQKNNNAYMSRLIMPSISSIVLLIVGFASGIFLNIKFGLMGNNILAGLSLSLYLTSFGLFFWYVSNYVKKGLFYVVRALNFVLNLDEDTFLMVIGFFNIVIGVSVGWIFGLLIGIFKIIKDIKGYKAFKPEYTKINNYIKENYKVKST